MELRGKKNKLYDAAASDPHRIQTCKREFGETLSRNEDEYIEDQRTSRRMPCDKGIDPEWYAAMTRRRTERELSQKYKDDMEEMFLFVDLDEMDKVLSLLGE